MGALHNKILRLGEQLRFNKFCGDQRGSLFIFLALAIVPLLAFIGLSVDMSRTYHARSLILNAADAAAMAAAKVPQTEAKTEAERVFNAYIAGTAVEDKAKVDSVVINMDKKYIDVKASTDVDMTFIRIIGYDHLGVGGTSRVAFETGGLEVVLAIDNTSAAAKILDGSNRMTHVKGGAYHFLDSIFDGQELPDDLFVSIVPFVGQVNVGPRTSWLTTQGQSDVADTSKFPNKKMGTWMGCMEARLSGNDHKLDTPPTTEATRFMPFWWPSTEQDPYPYPNGSVQPWGSKGTGDNDWTSGKISPFGATFPVGPNVGCPAQVATLTNDQDILDDKVREMSAIGKGGQFIFTGFVWAWRMLSPKWRGLWHSPNPYGLPKDYKASHKAIVMLANGGNGWIGTAAPFNDYGDRQYTSYGRWYGSAHSALNQNVIQPNTLNDYTREICDNIRDQGIIVYTITFATTDQPTLDMMRYCATDDEKYFEAQSAAELKSVFEEIANQLKQLRYTWPDV